MEGVFITNFKTSNAKSMYGRSTTIVNSFIVLQSYSPEQLKLCF